MILVGIINILAAVDTGTTCGGDTVCVGSGASADSSTVASAIVTNCLLLSGEASIATAETPDIKSSGRKSFSFILN